MKKTHRFITNTIPDSDTFSISDRRIVHQVKDVLKLKPAEKIIVFTDGGHDEVVTIQSLDKDSLMVKRDRTIKENTDADISLIAAVSIPKGSVFETIVQKLTEIGVNQIVPIISTRTVKEKVRIDRLQTISDEALEQCGGRNRTIINEPILLVDCLKKFPHPAVVFDPEGQPFNTLKKEKQLVMYIGPEGGWDEKDLEIFQNAGAVVVSLGKRILRTETATIVGAYQILWASY